VRIGLACDQLGFEHKERLKARVTRQGHAAEDLSAEQAGEYRAITDQLASAIRRGRQFVLEERIHRVRELLVEGNEKIVDIALGVGFENQAHFTTVFGNLAGMTPRQFQRSSERDSGRVFGPLLPVVEGC
jgi:AraC-like DNA-binding protein